MVSSSGWAYVATGGQKRWRKSLLAQHITRAADGRVYLSGAAGARWLDDLRRNAAHRYPRRTLSMVPHAPAVVFKCYRVGAPRDGSWLFFQLRDAQAMYLVRVGL